MIKTHKVKVPANIAIHSLVGIHSKDYPLSYGNYFSMSVEREYQIPNLNESMSEEGTGYGFRVCNFNCENFEEAISRFLLDNEVEITIFQVDEKYPFIAITDERIPEKWYHLWSEDMGYCNGSIHGKNYEEVARTLGKRFGGNENYVFHKNGEILKQCEVVNFKDVPKYSIDLKEWEKLRKIQKIKYEVGDECVFEITKGDKKWTISLDDFFNKVIQVCGEKQDD